MALDFQGIRSKAEERWRSLTEGDRPWIRVGAALCGQAAGCAAAAGAVGDAERILHAPAVLHEILAGLTFTLSPTSFFQTNTVQAARLLECIHSEVQSFEGRVLDLYCGAGTIGLSLASAVKEVVGLESSASRCLLTSKAFEN